MSVWINLYFRTEISVYVDGGDGGANNIFKKKKNANNKVTKKVFMIPNISKAL